MTSDMLLAALIIGACVCAGAVQAHNTESKAPECNWIPKDRDKECPTEPPMENDVLKRRKSGLLAEPGN